MCRMYFVATMMYYMLNTCKSMHLNKQPDIRKVTNYMTVQLQLVKTEMARL